MWLLHNFECQWMQFATFHQKLQNLEFGWLWKRWGRGVFVETRTFKCEGERKDYIMNSCLVMFLRRRKTNVVQHWWNIVVKLKVDKWTLSKWLTNLKPEILMLHQGNYFVVCVKLRQTHCIDDQDKVQSVTVTDNEFTECQTARKKLQLFWEL